jgi:molecular chaperone Hsp33
VSELHKFIFDGIAVRGIVVRLTDAWTQILRRRASNTQTGPYAPPVRRVLGEMLAAATLMQSNIKFDGALIVQIFGDGPVKLVVAEVQSDLSLRATATVVGELGDDASLSAMLNRTNLGRCAITLDPKARFAGQQPYQGVVPLYGDRGEKLERLSDVLQHYMLQSEQLDTTLVLAADDKVAAGLLIQRLPLQGEGKVAGSMRGRADEDEIGRSEHYHRIATLASSLQSEELLTLDVDTLLRRLFWQEEVVRFEPLVGQAAPHFACSCNRDKVAAMLVGLGAAEAQSIIAEQGQIEVACEFCGVQYRFDPIDAAQLFRPASERPGGSATAQ